MAHMLMATVQSTAAAPTKEAINGIPAREFEEDKNQERLDLGAALSKEGAEQSPLAVGLVNDFPTEDDASLEADRLGLRVTINCGVPQGARMKFCEHAEYYLKVEFDPEVTASPKSENTKPIVEHYARDILVAKWGN